MPKQADDQDAELGRHHGRHGCFSASQSEHKGPLSCLPHSACQTPTPPHYLYSQVPACLGTSAFKHDALCGRVWGPVWVCTIMCGCVVICSYLVHYCLWWVKWLYLVGVEMECCVFERACGFLSPDIHSFKLFIAQFVYVANIFHVDCPCWCGVRWCVPQVCIVCWLHSFFFCCCHSCHYFVTFFLFCHSTWELFVVVV